jgi:ubiquinone/menaquinone biosynthesis C-methylase UbiE
MDAEIDPQHARKSSALAELISKSTRYNPRDILVVGCGSGLEAGILARHFEARTIGIDLDTAGFDLQTAAPATLVGMDARKLDFADASIDLVFSFHALEHMPNPDLCLAEMNRVLRPGGYYLVGTPNKARLLGYLGSSTSLMNKIRWNLDDLRMRLVGKWSNEAGAHAGFTAAELSELCRRSFAGVPAEVSDSYYRRLYRSKQWAVDMLISSGLKSIVFPCVYVYGAKPSGV